MILFKDFSYSTLFDNMSICLDGNVVYLTGCNGCGKSSLAYVILGLLKGYKGSVSINGNNINNMSDRSLNRCVGIYKRNVDTTLINGSVFEYYQYCDIISLDYDKIYFRDILIRDLPVSKRILLKIITTSKQKEIIILDEIIHKLENKDFDYLKKYFRGRQIIIITNYMKLVKENCYMIKNKKIVKETMSYDFNYKNIVISSYQKIDEGILDNVFYLDFSNLLTNQDIEDYNLKKGILNLSVHNLSTGEHIILRLTYIAKNKKKYFIDGLIEYLDDKNKEILISKFDFLEFSIYGKLYEK